MRRPSYLTASIARFSGAVVTTPEQRAQSLFWWLFLVAFLVIGSGLCFVLKKEAEAFRELERIHRIPPEIREQGLRLEF
jgi:cytochrome c-type biogenesis protein CcmH/NrfF